MQDDVVALFAYDRWANPKVLDACRKLTAEQYVAEPVPGWSSVRSTIYHIALATEFNLRTLAGDPDDRIPTEADLATVDDVAQLLELVCLPPIRVVQKLGVPTISEVDSDRIRHVPKKGTAILTGFLAGNDCQRERLNS